MNSEDRERFNILIGWLVNYYFNHQIGVVYNKFLPPTAKSKSYNYPSDLVVINGNWHPETEIPFIFAHEVGHTIENTPIFNRLSYLSRQKGEYSANVFAINLSAQYYFENDIQFNSIFDFAAVFGIPHDKWVYPCQSIKQLQTALELTINFNLENI